MIPGLVYLAASYPGSVSEMYIYPFSSGIFWNCEYVTFLPIYTLCRFVLRFFYSSFSDYIGRYCLWLAVPSKPVWPGHL